MAAILNRCISRLRKAAEVGGNVFAIVWTNAGTANQSRKQGSAFPGAGRREKNVLAG